MIPVEILGDKPEACYGLTRDKDPYRSTPHVWRAVGGMIEVCAVCGGMRGYETEESLAAASPETRALTDANFPLDKR